MVAQTGLALPVLSGGVELRRELRAEPFAALYRQALILTGGLGTHTIIFCKHIFCVISVNKTTLTIVHP